MSSKAPCHLHLRLPSLTFIFWPEALYSFHPKLCRASEALWSLHMLGFCLKAPSASSSSSTPLSLAGSLYYLLCMSQCVSHTALSDVHEISESASHIALLVYMYILLPDPAFTEWREGVMMIQSLDKHLPRTWAWRLRLKIKWMSEWQRALPFRISRLLPAGQRTGVKMAVRGHRTEEVHCPTWT